MKRWTKKRSNTTGITNASQSTSSLYPLRKKIFTSNEDLLEEFALYDVMKNKGFSDKECEEMLEIGENVQAYFAPLIKNYLSIQEYVDGESFRQFVLYIEQLNKEMRDTFFKNGSYTVVLFTALVFSAFFFDCSIIPMLNNSLVLWEGNDRSLIYFQWFLRSFWIGMLLMLTVAGVLCFRLRNKHFYYRFYLRLYVLFPGNILVKYSSLYFALYYCSLLKNGCSTQRIVASLEHQKVSRIISTLSRTIREGFHSGSSASEIFSKLPLEKRLRKLFVIGESTGELEVLLTQYVAISKALLFRQYNRLMKTVQYAIYFLTGILLSILYRLLMSPLSVISQF